MREAICVANANGTLSDTITFFVNVITLNDRLPNVGSTIIINGNGGGLTIIQGNATAGLANNRIIQVRTGGNLTLNNLTIRNGRCAGSCVDVDGDHYPNSGGGILNNGTLNVTNCTFSGNSSTVAHGGGIYNSAGSTLNVSNSNFTSNRALDFGSGGGIFNGGTLTLTNSTLSGNYVIDGTGGGLFNNGTMNLLNSTLSANYSTNGLGGGLLNNGTLNYSN